MTTQELAAGLNILRAVADTVRELGRAPRGTLYAALMARGITLPAYEKIESILVGAGLVRRAGDCLVWALADDHAEFNAEFEAMRQAAGPHNPLSL